MATLHRALHRSLRRQSLHVRESNFPRDKRSCGYTELWNAFKRITAGASSAEKTALCNGTAARVYRLTAP